MYYFCPECRSFFAEDTVVEYECDDMCPLYSCDGDELQKVKDRIFPVIKRLVDNDYSVRYVRFDSDSVQIDFYDVYEFGSLPKDFDIVCRRNESYNPITEYYYCDGDGDFYIYHKSPESELTPEQLSDIAKDLMVWVNKICKPIF